MKKFSFNDIVGHELICKKLRQGIDTGKSVSAYLFSGPEGIGKKTVSRAFAAALLCQSPKDGEACHTCPSCRLFEAGSHPDFLVLSTAEDKKSIGIDPVREQIIKEAYVRPFHAERKVFVIENGELLTTDAQNALLKILEEPPAYAVFLLLSSAPDQLLETIRSRCLKLQLTPLSSKDCRAYFQALPETDAQKKALAASFSQGILGKGLKIIQDENYYQLYTETVSQLIGLCRHRSAPVDFEQFLTQNKEQVHNVIDFMLMFFRDCLRTRLSGNKSLICADRSCDVKSFSDACSAQSIVRLMESTVSFRKRLLQNAGFTIAVLELLTNMQEELHD